MIDTFDSDLISFFLTIVVPILIAFFVFFLIMLFISRRKRTQSYDRWREGEYDMKDLRRRKEREMRERHSEAKRSPESPAKAQVVYAKSEQGLWAKLSNKLRTLTSFKHSKGSGENETEAEQQSAQDDRGMEAEKRTLVATSEAGDLGGAHWELIEIRKSIATLTRQSESYQEVFLEELREIRGLLEGSAGQRTQGTIRHSSERSAGQRVIHQGSSQRSQSESRSAHRKESSLETLCRLYNTSAEDQNKQQEFKQIYSPILIGATNYGDCARDPNISPEFGEKSDGDFEAIEAQDGRYIVVPRFKLVVQEAKYGPGGVGTAFKCNNYYPGETYRHIKLIQPAYFITDGQTWKVDVPGELHLS